MKSEKSQQIEWSLREQRLLRGWSQQTLADLLGTTTVTISRWENGTSTPSPYFRLKLSQLFGRHIEETDKHVGEVHEDAPVLLPTSAPWFVPYRRNPLFTGRQELLELLHTLFRNARTEGYPPAYALTGLGGIGKTQVALEYAYRCSGDYTAIFWINAATSDTLVASLVAIADLLGLFEHAGHAQHMAVAAVIRWLTLHQNWLLILDDVEELEVLKAVMPTSGALLLTTRLQTLGTLAHSINLEPMTPQEGSHFLLRRAGLLRACQPLDNLPPQELSASISIVEALGGLPLALDQVGAYIDEVHCRLIDYADLFQTHATTLLAERGRGTDHPLSIVQTITLAFAKLQQSAPVAAALLTFCCFLAPDAIPEGMLTEAAAHLGPQLQSIGSDVLLFNNALKALRSCSLIRRERNSRTLTIHRLVQAVLIAQMDEPTQVLWAGRAVIVINQVFLAQCMNVQHGPACERLLPHALAVMQQPRAWEKFSSDVLCLLFKIAQYLTDQSRFEEAEALYSRALAFQEHILPSVI